MAVGIWGTLSAVLAVISADSSRASAIVGASSNADIADNLRRGLELEMGRLLYRKEYQRPSYPEYCSTPPMMAQRGIPPLPSNRTDGVETQILSATFVIRHGARTPYTPLQCWEGYDTFSRGQEWDCNLKSLMAPARHPTSPSDTGLFLFQKVYDALRPPLYNIFNGTCLKGQLLDEGYDMELANGRHIREAYIDTPHGHMQLFDSPRYEDRPYEKSTYFRADDEQRTLMSGQILVSGIWDVRNDTTMKLHTADYDVDVLSPHESICPKLTDIKREAYRSPDYLHLVSTEESRELNATIQDRLRPPVPVDKALYNMADCLMTTMCTDRSLPGVLDDFGKDGDTSMFSRMFNYARWQNTYYLKFKDAAYSKLAMGPLWAEILPTLQTTRDCMSLDDTKTAAIPRMTLVSAHDFTIMPLLASLGSGVWDGSWTPYASMFVIESHVITSGTHPDYVSGHAFRLIYNGDVITSRMDGCTSDLCDLDVLISQILPFATRERDCRSTSSHLTPNNNSSSSTTSSSPGVFASMEEKRMYLVGTVLAAIACSVLTGFVTFVYATGRLPCSKRYLCPRRVYDEIGIGNGAARRKEDGTTTRRSTGLDSTFSAATDGYLDSAVEVTTAAAVGQFPHHGNNSDSNGQRRRTLHRYGSTGEDPDSAGVI